MFRLCFKSCLRSCFGSCFGLVLGHVSGYVSSVVLGHVIGHILVGHNLGHVIGHVLSWSTWGVQFVLKIFKTALPNLVPARIYLPATTFSNDHHVLRKIRFFFAENGLFKQQSLPP